MLIREQLLNNEFYQKSMSLFLKATPGIPERIAALVEVLQNVNQCSEDFFRALDVFDVTGNSQASGEWLDTVGSILGLHREVQVVQYYLNGAYQNTPSTVIISLTDEEYKIYIQAQIRKYIFDGSRESLREAYRDSSMLNYFVYLSDNSYPQEIKDYLQHIGRPSALATLGISYIDDGAAACKISLGLTNTSDNIKNLFLSSYLTIESLGVEYTYVISNEFETAMFYKDGSGAKFYKVDVVPHALFA